MTLRTVDLPESARSILDWSGFEMSRSWLSEWFSGLATNRMKPSLWTCKMLGLDPDAPPFWLHSLIDWSALKARVSVRWGLLSLQHEQSLGKDPTVYDASYEILGETDSPLNVYPKSTEYAEHSVRTHGGKWVRVRGVWKMIAACGCGIPDRGFEPPWDTVEYLGFDRQILHNFLIAAQARDSWKAGARIRDIVNLAGKREKVETGSPAANALLRWNENESVMVERGQGILKLFA